MKFQFRFGSLLQLRRRERDLAAVALAQAGEAIARIEGEITDIESSRAAARSDAVKRRVGEISVDDLLLRGRYDLQLEAELTSLRETLGKLVTEAANRRQALVDAEADVKRFERLAEKDRAQFLAEQKRREQFESDDAASRRYTLQQRPLSHDQQTH